MTATLQAAVPEGEALRYSTTTRGGDQVGLTDRRLLLVDDEPISVSLTDVDEVTVGGFDWFLGVLSVVLVGFGLFSLSRNPLAGVAFAVAGAVSLVVTYRKRGQVRVHARGRARPLTFRLDETDAFEATFRRQVETFEHESEDPRL